MNNTGSVIWLLAALGAIIILVSLGYVIPATYYKIKRWLLKDTRYGKRN